MLGEGKEGGRDNASRTSRIIDTVVRPVEDITVITRKLDDELATRQHDGVVVIAIVLCEDHRSRLDGISAVGMADCPIINADAAFIDVLLLLKGQRQSLKVLKRHGKLRDVLTMDGPPAAADDTIAATRKMRLKLVNMADGWMGSVKSRNIEQDEKLFMVKTTVCKDL